MKPLTLSKLFFSCPCCDAKIEKAVDSGHYRIWSDKDKTEVRVCTPCSENITSTVLAYVVTKIDPEYPKF